MTRDELFDYALKEFGIRPEYLWTKYPDYAVLRAGNGKWFGIVMNVPGNKLGKQENEEIDILDVKCDPGLIGDLRLKEGFLPAYHMNKEKWISIILAQVPNDEIEFLLGMSCGLVDKHPPAKTKSTPASKPNPKI